MEERPERPKSTEGILAQKKDKLLKQVELMLDFKKSEALTRIVNEFKDLSEEEIDYIKEYVRLTDFQVNLRGPFPDTAREGIKEIEKNLGQMKEKVRPEIINKLEEL